MPFMQFDLQTSDRAPMNIMKDTLHRIQKIETEKKPELVRKRITMCVLPIVHHGGNFSPSNLPAAFNGEL